MKVEVWSDIACPYCYLGKHHLEKALQEFEHREKVEVEYKSFELDRNAKINYNEDIFDLLAKKYGQTREWALKSAQSLANKGKEIGLQFNFEQLVPTNTFMAHRLIHFAESKGLGKEAKELLFEAYFRDGRHIGESEILVEIAKSLGFSQEETQAFLESDRYSAEVRDEEQLAARFGINGVPFFVINRKYGISGAQAVEYFKEALSKAFEEEEFKRPESEANCGPEECKA